MFLRATLLLFLACTAFTHAQRYDRELIGRWKVEFQDPPERRIVQEQLRSLNLGHLAYGLTLPQLDPLIITISRNKLMVQSNNELLEVYNCVLEPDSIAILDRQERLSPVPLEYDYKLDGDRLTLTGTLNKINDLPVKLELRRVMSIPVYVDGTRGWLTRDGFLDVGSLAGFRNNVILIQPKDKPLKRFEIGQLNPLDQISLHEPELVKTDRIQANFEEEKKRFLNLPYPILTSSNASADPIFFTKKYFFDEEAMSEGYLITIYNTEEGDVTFRATGTGGGTSRDKVDIRYMKDRKDQDRMIVWIGDDEIFERPLEEVAAEKAAAQAEATEEE